jgi:hypothetical protein
MGPVEERGIPRAESQMTRASHRTRAVIIKAAEKCKPRITMHQAMNDT